MKKFVFSSLLLIPILGGATAYAQEHFDRAHRCGAASRRAAARTTVASSEEDKYDVKYVKLDLNMTNASTTISGNVITEAVPVVGPFSTYVFEIKSPLVVDSVLFNGINEPFTISGDLCSVPLSSPVLLGNLFTAQVFYHGTPVSGSTFMTSGIYSLNSPSWGTRATFTLSESYHAADWWPCKQALKDKIDSCDIWITVADSLKAGSNGLLANITTIDADHKRYEWKERYPIDYYLISAAVAPYVDYSYYMHFTGSSDSMLVQNYVYSNPATLPFFQSVIDSTGMMIDYFSGLYSRYPFWKEKYGHCMGRLSGGMEHQTMTTLGYFEGTLVAHELGHQWFGDNATCATWADIFVNEGFAAYTEYLFIDHFRNHALATTDIRDRQDNVKSVDTGTIFVDDTTSEDRIFDGRLTYDKGACVLHMLRSVVNNDSVFFSIYKTYQQQQADSVSTINDFANVAKAVAGPVPNGISLDTFFNQWMYKEGFPKYTVTWNQADTNVYIKISQNTAVPSSVSYFSLPVEVKLTAGASSTIVRLTNTQQDQVFNLSWNFPISSVSVNPNYWLLCDVTSVTRDISLGTPVAQQLPVAIAPNPSASGWAISNLLPGSDLLLTDISGRVLWTAVDVRGGITVPGASLATGVYLLRSSGATSGTWKVVKQ